MNAQRIHAYECNTCHHVFHVREDAEKCCRCKCGEPKASLEYGMYDHRCEKCRRRDWKREAQRRVRQLRKDLASAEATLKEICRP